MLTSFSARWLAPLPGTWSRVGRHSVEQFTRPDWRAGRRGRDEGGHWIDRLARPADHWRLYRALAAARILSGAAADPDRVVAVRPRQSTHRGTYLPMAAIRGCVADLARPWRQ